MARTVRNAIAVVVLGLAATARAGEMDKHGGPPAEPPDARFEALKALAGEWEGKARQDGKAVDGTTKATIKVVSGGSAVMLVTDPGTPHEMVTMFHRDDGALIATHYCAGMNQPRLRARAGDDPNAIAFEFQDGTNLKAHPGRMEGLVMAMPKAGSHLQTWTYRDGATASTMQMELTRAGK
jgi:hypothetical protein